MADPYRFGGPIPTKAQAVKAARQARQLLIQLARRRERVATSSMTADPAASMQDSTLTSSVGRPIDALKLNSSETPRRRGRSDLGLGEGWK